MRFSGSGASALFLSVLLVGCGEGKRESEDEDPGSAAGSGEHPTFSGQRAYALVEKQLAFGPRVPGTEGHEAQARWMVEYLSERAALVVADTFRHTTSAGASLEMANIFARFEPDLERRLLLLTHWDTRPQADQSPDSAERHLPVPGANDGGSGTAILLELADLMAGEAPPVGVDLLFTDGEDYGPGTEDMFLGARHFANSLTPDRRPAYAVLLDMVGDRDPSFPPEAYSVEYASDVVRRVWGIASDLGYSAYFPLRVGSRILDDHLSLNEAGIPTINIIDFDYGPDHRFWHTLEDRAENVSASTLEMVGSIVTTLVYRGG